MSRNINIRELEAFRDRINKLSQVGFDKVEQKLCKNLANRVIRAAVKTTPVKSGHLKGNYRMTSIHSTGNGYVVKVYNPVKYAPYVEYGHRTRGGGWCDGKYMLTKATEQVKKNADAIVEREITKEIKRALQ